MVKPPKKTAQKKAAVPVLKPLKKKASTAETKKLSAKKTTQKKSPDARIIKKKLAHLKESSPQNATANILDELFDVITSRKTADPAISHSARLLARGRHKIAQKFGEEAVECLIEATAGNNKELISESADVLYHLIVMWVDAGITPSEIWEELARRQGISGIAEKASRPREIYSILLSEE